MFLSFIIHCFMIMILFTCYTHMYFHTLGAHTRLLRAEVLVDVWSCLEVVSKPFQCIELMLRLDDRNWEFVLVFTL